MSSLRYRLWQSKIVTLVMFALLATSTVYWALRGMGAVDPVGMPVLAAEAEAPLNPQSVARALGGGKLPSATEAGVAQPGDSRRFALLGVLADASSDGAALISVDGKAAKPFRVGASVDGRLVLQSVLGRRAQLGSSMAAPAEITLELTAPDKR